ncbi:MAG: hypothetical protein ACPGJS_02070 [Flammeovirgaceae bacterium]
MTTKTNRAVSPESLDDINEELVQLFENTSFTDEVTRLSVELRAVELITEKQVIEDKLRKIASSPIEWKEATLELNPEFENSKGQFIKKSQRELARWKNKLKKLQHKARKHKSFLGQGLQQRILMLRTRKDFLHLKLEEMKAASNKHWKHVKSQFELRMNEFNMAYQEVLQEF